MNLEAVIPGVSIMHYIAQTKEAERIIWSQGTKVGIADDIGFRYSLIYSAMQSTQNPVDIACWLHYLALEPGYIQTALRYERGIRFGLRTDSIQQSSFGGIHFVSYGQYLGFGTATVGDESCGHGNYFDMNGRYWNNIPVCRIIKPYNIVVVGE